jgi:DNA-binding transcriptional ArsR family regulator
LGTAETRPAKGAGFPRLQGKAGVVAEALLAWPPDHPVNLTELAERAEVSKPLASRILGRLVELGMVTAEGEAPHRHWAVSDTDGLLERWVEEGAADVGEASSLYLWAANPEERYRKLQQLSGAGVKWALRGVPAANVYTPHLSTLPDPEIWVAAEEPIERIASLLSAEKVSSGGNMLVRQEDRDLPLVMAQELSGSTWRSGLRAVSPQRAVAESMRVSGRGPDVAAHLLGVLRGRPNQEAW